MLVHIIPAMPPSLSALQSYYVNHPSSLTNRVENVKNVRCMQLQTQDGTSHVLVLCVYPLVHLVLCLQRWQ